MAALDWVLLAMLLASMLLGAWRGLVYEVLSVVNWVAAFVLAQWLAPDVGAWLPMGETAAALRHAAGFVVVFVAALFAGGLVAWGARRIIQAIGLQPVDRALGALFGLARGLVLVLAAALVVQLTPLKSAAWWQASEGAAVATALLKGLKPVLPDAIGPYLPG